MPPSHDQPPAARLPGRAPSAFDRLSTIRFPLALSLLFLHNDRGGDFSARMLASPVLADTVRLVSAGLGGFRLPTFFLIAGYLFFRAVPARTTAWFGGKIASRTRSLLLPLVAWNLFGLVSLAVVQQIPGLASFLNAASGWSTPVADFTPAQWAAALVGGLREQPIIYPLWFLHDLFILVLLTPLIHAAIRASRGTVTLAVVALWLAGVRNPLVSPDALLFFFVGCHAAIARRSLFSLDAVGPLAALGWLGLQFVDTADLLPPLLAGQLGAVFGVIAVLALSGALARRPALVGWTKRAEPFGYFLFFAHEPLLTVARKASFKWLQPRSPAALLVDYFAVIAVVTVALFGFYALARRAAPGLLAVMTGGRSARARPVRPAPGAVPAAPAAALLGAGRPDPMPEVLVDRA